MSFEPAIELKKVSKIFSVDIDRARKNTARRILLGRFLAADRLLPGEEYLFKDLTFSLARGERLAVLAAPGAGKTALLNLLLGLSPPTSGKLVTRGRVRLVQGRCNVDRPLMHLRNYVMTLASLLGADWGELERLADDILLQTGGEFSANLRIKDVDPELFKRITIRTQWLTPAEIFLLDGVDYRQEPLAESVLPGKAVVFTTASAEVIPSDIERCLILHGGSIVFDGPVPVARSIYGKLPQEPQPALDLEALRAQIRDWERAGAGLDADLTFAPPPNPVFRKGTGDIRIREIEIRDSAGKPVREIPFGEGIEFAVKYSLESETAESKRVTQVTVALDDELGRRIGGFPSEIVNFPGAVARPNGELICRAGKLPLLPGRYNVTASISVEGELADKSVNEFSFRIGPADPYGTGKLPITYIGPVCVGFSWKESSP